ncbi:MAG: 30S ribosomal protein S5 [Planctomycetes bacterium]|nr:30S ribosomal protein S5 [Planctomycetota bacterium]
MGKQPGGSGGGGFGGREGRGGDRRDKTKGRRRKEERQSEYKETVVKINRCASVQKGGRRFSFAALAVVGDERGRVGVGYGKANEVPPAVNKALKEARDSMVKISILGDTIPHEIVGEFSASKVVLKPAAPGTGVIAGQSVRAVLDACGVRNILSKAYGNTNPINLVKATMTALRALRTKEEVAALRGVQIP